MNERVYKIMSGTGAASIAVGVVMIVVGIASGVILLVSGAKLIKSRYDITF